MPAGDVELVTVTRHSTNSPWGFNLGGGRDHDTPMFILKCFPGSPAFKAGLRDGDGVLQLNRIPTANLTLSAAKAEVARTGTTIDIAVQREMIDPRATGLSSDERVEIVEEPCAKFGEGPDPTLAKVTPKTYKIIEDTEKQAAGPAPSVFAKRKADRSKYTQCKGTTIQKAYGES
ncbi:PDZ and LIM domain protein 3 [Lingula anatina]|uniref:PDZ and LIM domain protein 3 n=1 Tax=Lingula anatina TaxID=7574 RepID=A0A1S3IM04_LINAN|nr:PDZ and LIM domain protein 3 [Lingula anatina]|eukprot:XP_013398931.1 PDZ and LIM domain protein 3 [Lingula anatina]